MANIKILTWSAENRQVEEDSSSLTIDFTALRIGQHTLVISEATPEAFNFNAKEIQNILDPTEPSSAATAQYVQDMMGGGFTPEIHGSALAPVAVDPAVGIAATGAPYQIWWVTPNTGFGAVPIVSSRAIAPGTLVGQVLVVKSVANANYLVIPNQSGTDQNDECNMGPLAQSITYTWDDINWSEDTRRV